MPEILLCGSEGEQFLYENSLQSLGKDDKRRGSVLLSAGDQMYRRFDQEYDDFWVHCRLAVHGITGIGKTTNLPIISVMSNETTLATIRSNMAAQSQIGSLRFDAMDTGPSFPAEHRTFLNYDIRIVATGDNSCEVYFYRNEVLRRRVTLNTALRPNAVQIQYQAADPDLASVWIQDVVVTDGIPTVGMELAVLVPSAVGNYDDFSNDYSSIDDLGYDQTTVMSSTTIGDRESWFFADPEFNIGDKVIYGVVMTTVAQLDLANNLNDFEPFLRMNATNYATVGIGANEIAPNAYVSVWTTNPATGAPWNMAELRGLEAGLRAI
ncbi:hypothetical protein RPALISO_65 [Ruegeria phage RpAliso]|nr:hypothetical protein RPALISO_65 [Ruegeria phage RpAliso]